MCQSYPPRQTASVRITAWVWWRCCTKVCRQDLLPGSFLYDTISADSDTTSRLTKAGCAVRLANSSGGCVECMTYPEKQRLLYTKLQCWLHCYIVIVTDASPILSSQAGPVSFSLLTARLQELNRDLSVRKQSPSTRKHASGLSGLSSISQLSPSSGLSLPATSASGHVTAAARASAVPELGFLSIDGHSQCRWTHILYVN